MNPVRQDIVIAFTAAGCEATEMRVVALSTVKISCGSEASFTVHVRTRLPDGIVLDRKQIATGEAYFIGVDNAHAYVLSRWTPPPTPMPPSASPR